MSPELLVVVLAAGASRRLGTSKQLVSIDGEPLLRRQCRCALDAHVGRVLVILGCHADLHRRVISDLPIGLDVNDELAGRDGRDAPPCSRHREPAASRDPGSAVRSVSHHAERSSDSARHLATDAVGGVRVALARLCRPSCHSADRVLRGRIAAARATPELGRSSMTASDLDRWRSPTRARRMTSTLRRTWRTRKRESHALGGAARVKAGQHCRTIGRTRCARMY